MDIPASGLLITGACMLAIVVGWLLVRGGYVSIFSGMGTVLGGIGIVALASGSVRIAGGVPLPLAAGVGAGAGILLYLATVGFMSSARGWLRLGRHTASLYERRKDVPISHALGVSLLASVPGEELFWRGLVPHVMAALTSQGPAAILAWALYVVVNLPSGSLPIVLGTVVGGALWAGLAAWSGGVAASIACHAVWTALMIARPPR